MRHGATIPTPFTELRRGTPLPIVDTYLGSPLFLVLSGPSVRDLPLEMLSRRGIVTMGVNNSPAVWRPHLWTAVDSPGKFHSAIWRDPGILKFVPRRPHSLVNKRLREKRGEKFHEMPGPRNSPACMPATIGMDTNQNFQPSVWLSEPTINCGNSLLASERNGHPNCVSVFFAAIKLAWTLGFRTIYLLGCDFLIDPGRPYAFDEQKRYKGDPNHDQSPFAKTRQMFGMLSPRFAAAGLRLFNCNPNSRMDQCDFIDFPQAVADATASTPETLDTLGWYKLTAQ